MCEKSIVNPRWKMKESLFFSPKWILFHFIHILLTSYSTFFERSINFNILIVRPLRDKIEFFFLVHYHNKSTLHSGFLSHNLCVFFYFFFWNTIILWCHVMFKNEHIHEEGKKLFTPMAWQFHFVDKWEDAGVW